jgi:hypothetical protein
MKYLMNVVLGVMMVVALRSLIHIYSSTLIGVMVLPIFIFMSILIIIITNHS